MTEIKLTVNGRPVRAAVEPRVHLGDFLREHLRLTGTHLGCEHGVCGACTVEIDGAPARACITFAATCDGAEIRTVEGFDDDPLMAELREAFSAEHALQCGFCTPGMLIAARDIVQRLPEADEALVRTELAGNLCRCTGYQGIAAAITRVIAERRARGAVTVPAPTEGAAPAFVPFAAAASTPSDVAPATPAAGAAEPTGSAVGWTELEESFVLGRPPAEVWSALDDLPMIAACLPGAELTERDGTGVKGRMRVKLGVIRASFGGAATIERDDARLTAVLRGGGADSGTGSRTRGEVEYRLEADGAAATRVAVTIRYRLQGPLAQFSRSSLARDFAGRLIAQFAENLNARLAGAEGEGEAPSAGQAAALEVGVVGWLKGKIGTAFGSEK